MKFLQGLILFVSLIVLLCSCVHTAQAPSIASVSHHSPQHSIKISLKGKIRYLSTGQSAHQALSYQDLIDNVNAGNFIWTSSAPSGSTLICNRTCFTTYVKNTGSGSCSGTGTYIMSYSEMTSCAILTSVHTPILANNGFEDGNFTSWTDSGALTVKSGSIAGAWSGAENGTYYATNYSVGNSGTITQTFTITGSCCASSSMTIYTVGFNALPSGDTGACPDGSPGTNEVSVYINSSLVADVTPGTTWGATTVTLTSVLTNGSNTIEIAYSSTPSENATYNSTEDKCTYDPSGNPSFLGLDNISITSTY